MAYRPEEEQVNKQPRMANVELRVTNHKGGVPGRESDDN